MALKNDIMNQLAVVKDLFEFTDALNNKHFLKLFMTGQRRNKTISFMNQFMNALMNHS